LDSSNGGRFGGAKPIVLNKILVLINLRKS